MAWTASTTILPKNSFCLEITADGLDGIDDHLAEELLLLGDNLRVEGGLSALLKKVTLLFIGLVTNLDRDFSDAVEAHLEGIAVTLDDDLRVHALFDESLGLLQELASG